MRMGGQMADHMRACLVAEVLQMAHTHGHVEPDVVFGSDRGTQYTSTEFARYCHYFDMRRPMGGIGVCWDSQSVSAGFRQNREVPVGALWPLLVIGP